MLDNPLARYLKRERISVTEFARRLGGKVSHAHVSNWTRGHYRPRLKTAQRIERVTGGAVTAAELLGLR